MRKTAVGPELGTQIKEYLGNQGYDVTEEARLLGKSGIEHTFDMLAHRDDGFTSYNVAIGIAAGGDGETQADSIFTLANKAYDCGILDRILIATPDLSQEAKELARKQRITVIDGDQIGQLLAAKPQPPVKVEAPVSLGTREELVKSLVDRGYDVKKKIKIRGKIRDDDGIRVDERDGWFLIRASMPTSSMTLSTRCRVFSETLSSLLTTRDTVFIETPACLATSCKVRDIEHLPGEFSGFILTALSII